MLSVALVASLIALLALNAFFVMAEFAIVRVRPSRVAELVAGEHPRAALLQQIQGNLDEYLGVCQVGITLASVALGMVGNRATEVLMGPRRTGFWSYVLAIVISYLVVSGSHIVLGEQVPKSIAIRIADRLALVCAPPLQFTRRAFWPVLWVLTQLTHLTLRLIGMRNATNEETHTEDELRIILEHSQESGMMSFRRLLFMENVFDFGVLTVRDSMRGRSTVRCLVAGRSWEENLATIRASRFSRYPVIKTDWEHPVGIVHLKDLVIRGPGREHDLLSVIRPILTTTETTPLEVLLTDMQRRRIHTAIVKSPDGQWTGFITLEDIIEELIGTIRDEFEEEEPIRLADALTLAHIVLNIEASSPLDAVRRAIFGMPRNLLPMPPEQIIDTLQNREPLVGVYFGSGIAMPHARLARLSKPFVMILRSIRGIPSPGTTELAHLLFVLLTPAGMPRVHLRLQSTIAALLHESEFVKDRLMTADTPDEILEAIRAGEQAALD
jgi:CBS domain containing-hemolysin-like protein/mannitol/fructose-specific phosphotransferase system IIA component